MCFKDALKINKILNRFPPQIDSKYQIKAQFPSGSSFSLLNVGLFNGRNFSHQQSLHVPIDLKLMVLEGCYQSVSI